MTSETSSYLHVLAVYVVVVCKWLCSAIRFLVARGGGGIFPASSRDLSPCIPSTTPSCGRSRRGAQRSCPSGPRHYEAACHRGDSFGLLRFLLVFTIVLGNLEPLVFFAMNGRE